ncbi:origin recognition complex subunit 3 isoform X10 [Eubalaena glacialis]|uniref:origin recognition complex subunit 3 isoform X10 n=1 Tax=Eubalaena glacialis TaxID=27606 RepID=UPI002A59FA12|nr:origin recognition complex subunit 3 isoform X10 [Eubalaena glacialis]
MATSSVSKGCFVFKPNFKKRKISVPIEDYFNKGKNESEDSTLRFETYQLIWQQMKSETERLQEELNKNLFDSLIEFLQKSHSGFQKNSRDWGCQIKLREIPTAALVLGVNVTDHDLTFRSLTEVLQNNVTPYVVSLQAKDCPDMKHFLQKLASQLMDCNVDVQSKEKEGVQVTQKKIHYSMDSLSTWYMNVTQLSLLEHFYSQPLSVLCCNLPEAKRRINFLSDNQCENIRRLPSFRRYVEKQASEKQVALLTNERFLKEETQSLLENLHVYHTNYFLVLRCLHQFTSSLPKYPLGRQIRELYCTCLEKNILDSEEYASALQLLRMLAKDELMAMLQKCFKVFKSSSEKQLGNTAKRIEEFLAQFQSLDAEAKEEEEDTSESQSKGLQKTDLYHLQKSLLEMKELRRTSKRQTKFEVLREQLVSFIDSLVREYLLLPETQPLHEVLYFSAAHTLRQHLNAAPRIALHTALNNPYYYLKNEALRSEEGCIPNVAPDICIAYKLHLECSRLINLVDWSEAFATVVTAAEKMDANSVTSEERNEIIHARFIRAVSELELLGFIKPTKQKTDHVARLTWGGC